MKIFKLPFSEAFHVYAQENNIGEPSYKSYLTYLKSLDKLFFKILSDPTTPTPFEMLSGKYLLNTPLKDIIDSLYDWKSWLDQEITSRQIVDRAENTLRNWMSAYTLYISFIENYFGLNETQDDQEVDEKDEEEISKPIDIEKVKKIRASKKITNKTLVDTSKIKLRTQDRLSLKRKANLPLYYISRVLNSSNNHDANEKFIDTWAGGLSKKITALIEKDGKITEVPISEIETIRFYGRKQPATLEIKGSNGEYLFITRTCNNDFQPMYLSRENEMHIDHEPSINFILTEYAEDFPALTRVSDIIKKIAKDNGFIGTEIHNPIIAKLILDNPKVVEEIQGLLPNIEKEMKFLNSKIIRLELMHSSQNCGKGKGGC